MYGDWREKKKQLESNTATCWPVGSKVATEESEREQTWRHNQGESTTIATL